jgi:hypothetical protein
VVSSAKGCFFVVHSLGLRRLLRLGLGWSVQGGDGCCHVLPFRAPFKVPFRFSLSSALSFFGPSLGSPFRSCEPQSLLWPLLTAPGLSTGGSPRVRDCSFRSCLWALQDVVDDCWASLVVACSPPTSCLTAHLCSFGRTFVFHPFAPTPCGADLVVDYGWRHRPRREPFIPIDQSPAWHTTAGIPAGEFAFAVRQYKEQILLT